MIDTNSTMAGPIVTGILERNLRAVARLSPAAAEAIRRASPRGGVEVLAAGDGSWTARVDGSLQASRHEPLREGKLLAEQAPIESAACIVVMGMGAGHHVAALAERMNRSGAIFVYEPDVALMRSIMQERDFSAWIDRSNVVVLVSEDQAAITASVSGLEGLLAAGVKILEHPASQGRIGRERAESFGGALTAVMRAVKTNVVTTFVQVETTLRNLLMNVDRYASLPGIADLAGVAEGLPAVVVAAGPSLERNIDLLVDPANRAKVVVIAAQTVLKKLLAKGIKPDFVTALDYHEISRRFYEGLSEKDVEGVTLVVEPKANPAILSAYPGAVRCPAERVLDELLGSEFGREMGGLTPGATVAHLAYYLARYLGCDPVILTGQDLGFTDGQYYHAGAAIHRVWAGELNEFNTLEMLEWQRIVRARNILHSATDHLGRHIYTDEQMAAYLVQFERDFAGDAALGKTTIDATEGGVLKKHTQIRSLREVLAEIPRRSERIPLPPARQDDDRQGRVQKARLRDRVASVRREAWSVEEISRKTADKLREMTIVQSDQKKIGTLIDQVHKLRDEVIRLQPAYGLVGFLNQTGGFKRFQADRAIELDRSLSGLERQKRQIERDITNVSWIGDAAHQLGSMLDSTLKMLDGGVRMTRDATANDDGGDSKAKSRHVRCVVFIPAFVLDSHSHRKDHGVVQGEQSVLELTLRRLGRAAGIDGVVIARDKGGMADRAHQTLKGEIRPGVAITVVDAPDHGAEWSRRVRGTRALSERCWRGGPANLTVWDELWRPIDLERLMQVHGADAGVLVGPDWCAIDPVLTEGVIERYRESPEMHPVTFSPAAPGLAPCVIGREMVGQLAEREATARTFATIGGVLGYVPALPRPDPIAKPPCFEAPLELRDAGRRCIADSREVLNAIRGAVVGASDAAAVDSRAVVQALTAQKPAAHEVVIDVRGDAAISVLCKKLTEACAVGEDHPRAITIVGDECAIVAGRVQKVLAEVAASGVELIHLKTGLALDIDRVLPLLEAITTIERAVVIVSVPMVAGTPETYRKLTGRDGYEDMVHNVRRLIRAARSAGDGIPGMPRLWVVPRITRCDAVYGEVEGFYDQWLMEAGACVIDPLPEAKQGERIAPLPRPSWVHDVESASRVVISAT
jgi:hypothetical protein